MAIRGEMPFIRIIKDIPREMRDRLPPQFIAILETTVSPGCHHERSVFYVLIVR